MARPKGLPKTGGRVKGQPNKLTTQIKDMIRAALDEAGGVDYLVQQSEDNPVAFLSLVGKLVPIDASVQLNDKRSSAMTDDELERHILTASSLGATSKAKGKSVTH